MTRASEGCCNIAHMPKCRSNTGSRVLEHPAGSHPTVRAAPQALQFTLTLACLCSVDQADTAVHQSFVGSKVVTALVARLPSSPVPCSDRRGGVQGLRLHPAAYVEGGRGGGGGTCLHQMGPLHTIADMHGCRLHMGFVQQDIVAGPPNTCCPT